MLIRFVLKVWLTSVAGGPLVVLGIMFYHTLLGGGSMSGAPYILGPILAVGLVCSLPSALLFLASAWWIRKQNWALPAKRTFLTLEGWVLTAAPIFCFVGGTVIGLEPRTYGLFLVAYGIWISLGIWYYKWPDKTTSRPANGLPLQAP